MKRIIIVLFVLLLLCGCQKQKQEEIVSEDEEETYLVSLPDKPSESDEIFLVRNGDLLHKELWDDFLKDYEEGNDCEIVYGAYTIEGDVIYYSLTFKDGTFELVSDNHRDQFGVPSFEHLNGKYLSYFEWVSKEEYSDGIHDANNYLAVLDDVAYKSQEEIYDQLKKDNTFIWLWAFQGKAK